MRDDNNGAKAHLKTVIAKAGESPLEQVETGLREYWQPVLEEPIPARCSCCSASWSGRSAMETPFVQRQQTI